MAISRWQAPDTQAAGPLDVLSWYDGPPVPDPITFIIGEDWLDKPNLYPRQSTLLKIIFLRDDLFTPYDHQVIREWQQRFTETNPDAEDNKFSARTKGLQPDLYERISYLKKRGYRWFPELIIAIGRRGSKGYLSAVAMAYVLWNYLAKGNPQEFYGIDQNKPLAVAIFAGKKEQAKENLWGDLYSVITTAPCYTSYISEAQAESLTVYAPYDFVRMHKLAQRGIGTTRDMASFRILPRESTPLAPRGPAGCILGFDEAAHVKNAGVTREFGVVYGAAKPSLDQFGTDGFIVLPSSTWEMIGKFYELWELSLQREPGPEPGEHMPAYPTKFMVQLESWAIYEDWERAHLIPLFPEGYRGDLGEYEPDALPTLRPLKGAIQAYDEEMAREEKANPDTFAVERRSDWATAMDAYLNTAKVGQMFAPWLERDERFGRPELTMQHRGPLSITYTAHGDPSSVNCRFGFSVAHTEPGPDGMEHAVFDLIYFWDPADFPDHIIDYDVPMNWILNNVVLPFQPDELTFDQFNCLNGDVLIPTPRGLLTMRELAGDLPVGDTKALNVPVQSQDGIATAVAIHHKGSVPVLRLRTKHGIDLTCTPEHRVLVRRAKSKTWYPSSAWEWITSGEIKTGDEVRLRLGSAFAADELDISSLVPVSQKSAVKHSEELVGALYDRFLAGETKAALEREFSMGGGTLTRRFRTLGAMASVVPPFTKSLDRPLAWLMGFLVAEANIGDRHWAVTQKDKKTISHALTCIEKSFGVSHRHSYDESYQGKYQVGWFRGSDLETRFLKSLGMDQVLAREKSVPWSIRRSPEHVVADFLCGLFEGDGSVVIRSSNDEEIFLTTTSERLGIEVQQLLHAMGILATRWEGTYRYKGETRSQWRVKIFGRDILRYEEKIGFISPAKCRALKEACEQILGRGGAVGLRDRLRRGDDWYFDKVTGIEGGGREDCYDISVPGPECFVAQGVIVHNSVASVQWLQKQVRASHLQKNVVVYERTATAALNWSTWETFKAALNMGLVHAPAHGEARDELLFLQKPEGQQKVLPASSGPVQTKDIADTIAITTARLLGEQMKAYLAKDLRNQRPHVAQPGGHDALDRFSPDSANPYAASLGGPMGGQGALARGMRPGMLGRGGRYPAGRLGAGPAGMRRHRSLYRLGHG